jgi:type IV secretory pathway VirB10-like protein
MRTPRISSALTATICAAALFALGCGRQTEEPQTADLETLPAVEQAAPAEPEAYPAPVPPADVELRDERSVEARDQVAAAERDDLDAHERELDQREAALEARAKRLRDLKRRDQELIAAEREIERRETAKAERPAPAPARKKPVREEPAREEPARAEPVEDEEVRETAPAPEPEPMEEPREEIRAEEARSEPVTVETGTVFSVELLERLSSEDSRPGETFRARVTGDVRQDGRVVIPAGSEVVGEVTEAVPLRKVGGRAKLAIRFSDLVLPSGTSVPIDASFAGQGRNETGRDAATIGGAAAGGAVLGRVLNKGDRSRGAVIGAIIGAVVGTAVASRTPGEEVTFDDGAVVDLRLEAPVEIRPRR